MTQRYWDERLETLPPDRRRLLREHRLHWQLRRCWDGSPFYRARLEAAGLAPATFRGLDDWRRLPALRAEELPAQADWAVAPESWWDHVERVPSQPPRVVTDGDAIQQADLAARALWAAGARPGQTFPLPDAPNDALFQAVMEAGARRIGTALTREDRPPETFVPFLGRPFLLPLGLYCREADVLHWNDDHFLIEVVEPSTGEPTPAGGTGALLVTDLAREGSPLLRFSTAYETVVTDTPCRCGRTSAWTPTLRPLA